MKSRKLFIGLSFLSLILPACNWFCKTPTRETISTELSQEDAVRFSQILAREVYKQLKKEPHESIEFLTNFLLIEAQNN